MNNDIKIAHIISEISTKHITQDNKRVIDVADVGNSYYSVFSGSSITIENNMFKFAYVADNGFIWNKNYQQPIPSNISYMIEFDFVIQDTNTIMTNKIQTLLLVNESRTTSTNYTGFQIMISPEYDWISYTFGNTSNGTFSVLNGYHKFTKDVVYNFKMIVLSNNVSGIYINDRLITKGNTLDNSRGTAYNYSTNTRIKNMNFYLGMYKETNTAYVLRGLMNNYRYSKIKSSDTTLYDNTVYGKNKLLDVPLDFKSLSTTEYQDVYIKNRGIKNYTIPYNNSASYGARFVNNLQTTYTSWFWPTSSSLIYFDSSDLKQLESFSISVRVRTADTLNTSCFLDTRTVESPNSGFFLMQVYDDPTALSFYTSNKGSSLSEWYEIITMPSGLLAPNAEYLVTILYKNTKFEIYIDDNKVGETTSGIIPNILNENIYFGSTINADGVFTGYIRDIRIYNDAIHPNNDVKLDVINPMADGSFDVDFRDVKYLKFSNPKHKLKFEMREGVLSKQYRGNNIYEKLYFYKEGGTGNEKIKLYESGRVFMEKIGELKFDYIPTCYKNRYSLRIDNGELIPLVNLSPIRGEIKGNIYISSCEDVGDRDEMVIRCFSSTDHRYIGEYPIVNGGYEIANLDATNEYDLILVDKTKILEQKILSHRKPEPYENT